MFSEKELISACIKNNHFAQKLFYQHYAGLIKGICARYESDKDLQKDLVQDAFIKVYTNLDKYSGEGVFEGWIRRITVNICIDFINTNKRIIKNSIEDNDYPIQNEVDNEGSIVNQLIDAGFTKEKLISIIHELPSNYACVFNMYFIDELSHNEIASHLLISDSLSRKWLFRAKDLLRKQIIRDVLVSKNVNL